MGLSCSCDDFDKSDFERWWEPGGKSVPPAWSRCCECNAPLPPEKHDCIVHMEVYDPGEIEPRPPHPEDVLDDEPEDVNLARFWAQRYDAMEADQEAYDDRHGWDSDDERYVRVASKDYRCERCSDLADSIEDLGYCIIAPGELAECHTEYVNDIAEHRTGPPIIWAKGKDRVWNPRPRTRRDDRRDAVRRRINRTKGFVWYGGWRTWLRYTAWAAIERRIVASVMRLCAYHKAYDHDRKRMAWRKMGPPDGMQWVRREMHRCGFEPHTWDHKRGGYIWRRAEREKETA